MKTTLFLLALAISGMAFADSDPETAPATTAITKAVATINPLVDSKVHGTVTFTTKGNGIEVVADIDGLTPGKHGFHVHEHGDCSGDGTAAGSHFNPTNSKHGAPWSKERHVGDLGNVVADKNGHAHYVWHDHQIAFSGPNSIIGRSIIVHSDADDYVSQPAGNSGKRIGCGIIEAAK